MDERISEDVDYVEGQWQDEIKTGMKNVYKMEQREQKREFSSNAMAEIDEDEVKEIGTLWRTLAATECDMGMSFVGGVLASPRISTIDLA